MVVGQLSDQMDTAVGTFYLSELRLNTYSFMLGQHEKERSGCCCKHYKEEAPAQGRNMQMAREFAHGVGTGRNAAGRLSVST
jgi:hypothetical protein